jgi:hypothetical protein
MPAAVDTIKSVKGVIFTVWPILVAIEFKDICLPLAVPVIVKIKGAVIPFTFTTKAPCAVVVAAGDITPLISIATTVPLIGTPTAAVPTKLALLELEELLEELRLLEDVATDDAKLDVEAALDSLQMSLLQMN